MSALGEKDVDAVIVFAIKNNKKAVIDSMNQSGYAVPADISSKQLFVQVHNVWAKDGKEKLIDVLNKVPPDTSKLTEEEAKNLSIKYLGASIGQRKTFGEWLNGLGQGIGNFLSGHTEIVQNGTVVTSEPVVSPWLIAGVDIAGLIAMVIIARSNIKNSVWIISVIGLMLTAFTVYGAFAKKVTQAGGGGSQTVYTGALGWLNGILDGFHLNIVGAG